MIEYMNEISQNCGTNFKEHNIQVIGVPTGERESEDIFEQSIA